MVRFCGRFCLAVLAVSACLPNLLPGQTVFVVTGPADNVTTFNTINAALASFDDDIPGVNSGNPSLINEIVLTHFGPFDEQFPQFGDASPAVQSLQSDGLTDGNEVFLIRAATGVQPLVRLQNGTANSESTSNFDGLVVTGGRTVWFKGVILAASEVAPPSDDLMSVANGGSKLLLQDCVVTALPASTVFTSVGDIPADLLDGTRGGWDSSLVRAPDDGVWVGGASSTPVAGGSCFLELDNTIMTQMGGTTATPDTIVASSNASIVIQTGTLISSGRRYGIQTTTFDPSFGRSDVLIAGTLGNPVTIRDFNTTFSGSKAIGDSIVSFNADHLVIENCRSGSGSNAGALNFRTSATRTDSEIKIRNTSIRNLLGPGSGIFLFQQGTNVTSTGVPAFDFDNIQVINSNNYGIHIFGDQEKLPLVTNSHFINCLNGGIGVFSDRTDVSLTIKDCTFLQAPLRLGSGTDTANINVNVIDSIIAETATGIIAANKGGGTVTVSYSCLPLSGPQALTAQDDDDPLIPRDFVTYGAGVLAVDPEFLPGYNDPLAAQFLAVNSCALKTASSTSGPLDGDGIWIDPGTCSSGPVPGDADADGDIDVEDVTAIYNSLPPLSIPLPPINGGDVNGDSTVDAIDATIIINFLVDGTPIP